ncbi:hypothetical protein GZ77_19930 [Endozoicomonas montiporae]|uniref:Flavin reductase like domain-containing protein n=2 Tax=Endozoicomonas montiporae TaxID=1027273 RepID=A0A081N2R5_9GAMM|nr:flavin reductase family protein [Endozoicomonas montiporae]AMO58003.1 hypothetical protein EZMO1_4075 [Endozoicomonas montiporae CL-33]KEQ12738.1 hypothetical protein GZ77_19930 [Endozoicomonas montiporae]
MNIDPNKVPVKDVYKLLISTVTPRPIAWVSSMDDQGIVNLAPFSFFNVVSVNPPVLGFSPLLDGTGKSKDTLNNIRNTKEFVVNVVSHQVADAMNQTSAPFEHHVDELQQAGLTAMPSYLVKPPSVQEAMVHYECRLHDVISFGNDPMAGNLILGQICHIHVNDELKDGDRINVGKLDTVGRMEGSYYSTTRDRFAIDRPTLD